MKNHKQPLAEVFGHLITDQSPTAERFRKNRLCPFGNKVPNCTKDKAKDPLGVCSIYHNDDVVITCPIRFRQGWNIANDAADFFFQAEEKWTSLTEVRLNDRNGKAAGNIDVVLAAYDDKGKVCDFGALEIQAVYITGNLSTPFKYFVADPKAYGDMRWADHPCPDYLSTLQQGLAPQLIFKGGILHSWKKKVAVALNKSFFETLPELKRVAKEKADIAWLIYDLKLEAGRFHLIKVDTIYTEFEPALLAITRPVPGKLEDFLSMLQEKLDEQIETPPVNEIVESPF